MFSLRGSEVGDKLSLISGSVVWSEAAKKR